MGSHVVWALSVRTNQDDRYRRTDKHSLVGCARWDANTGLRRRVNCGGSGFLCGLLWVLKAADQVGLCFPGTQFAACKTAGPSGLPIPLRHRPVPVPRGPQRAAPFRGEWLCPLLCDPPPAPGHGAAPGRGVGDKNDKAPWRCQRGVPRVRVACQPGVLEVKERVETGENAPWLHRPRRRQCRTCRGTPPPVRRSS